MVSLNYYQLQGLSLGRLFGFYHSNIPTGDMELTVFQKYTNQWLLIN